MMNKEELIEYCKEASLQICNMQHTIDKYKQVIDKIKEWKKQTLFDLNKQYKTFEYWEELFEDLDKILEDLDE